jgi:hypothetical protein
MHHGSGNDGKMPGDNGGHFKRAVARKRTDPQARVSAPIHVVKPGNAIDVDERGGAQQTEVKEWDQALPAGKKLGLATIASECRDRLGTAARLQVFESGRFHQCKFMRDLEPVPVWSNQRLRKA